MSTLSESELPAVFDIEHAVRIGDETYMPSCGKLSSDVEGKEWEDEMEDLATRTRQIPMSGCSRRVRGGRSVFFA
jgi:hypothetical protein